MPYLALLFNACVWGLSWLPLRHLQQAGLHPLWATMVFFGVGALCVAFWRPRAAWRVLQQPALWWLALAAGATNAAFNWGVSVGEVVRVVLLFYLMPLWAVGLAWWLLGERMNGAAALRVALALGGALLVLQPPGGGWPQFNGLADWLGLLGGMGFALTNVLLRRYGQVPASERAMAMFLGGLLLPGLVGLLLATQALVPAWPAPSATWLPLAVALGGVFLASNMALQYGAARVPVHITSVVMLTEIVFAAASAVVWGDEQLGPATLAGGALILTAALLAAREGG